MRSMERKWGPEGPLFKGDLGGLLTSDLVSMFIDRHQSEFGIE